MDEQESITRESGYVVVSELVDKPASVDRLSSLRDVALWIIDEVGYYLANSTMAELKKITDSGGVASIELKTTQGDVLLTVAKSA